MPVWPIRVNTANVSSMIHSIRSRQYAWRAPELQAVTRNKIVRFHLIPFSLACTLTWFSDGLSSSRAKFWPPENRATYRYLLNAASLGYTSLSENKTSMNVAMFFLSQSQWPQYSLSFGRLVRFLINNSLCTCIIHTLAHAAQIFHGRSSGHGCDSHFVDYNLYSASSPSAKCYVL